MYKTKKITALFLFTRFISLMCSSMYLDATVCWTFNFGALIFCYNRLKHDLFQIKIVALIELRNVITFEKYLIPLTTRLPTASAAPSDH